MIHTYVRPADQAHGKSQISSISQQTREAPAASAVGPKERNHRIAEAAYLRAERRGFAPGHDTQDWLEAEAEVDQPLTAVS